MTTVTHTEECLNAQRMHQAAMSAYTAKWYNACGVCNGWGGTISSYNPYPAGVPYSGGLFHEFQPCDGCYAQGFCPRCYFSFGQEYLLKSGPCPNCGWYEGTHGAPEPYDCDCWTASDILF